jgi:hypothetical protein
VRDDEDEDEDEDDDGCGVVGSGVCGAESYQ